MAKSRRQLLRMFVGIGVFASTGCAQIGGSNGDPDGGETLTTSTTTEEEDSWEGTPGKQAAINLARQYYEYIDQGNIDGVNSLFHPDSPDPGFSEGDLEGEKSDDTHRELEDITASIEGDTATVRGKLIFVDSDDGTEIAEFIFEFKLREYNGEWRIWE